MIMDTIPTYLPCGLVYASQGDIEAAHRRMMRWVMTRAHSAAHRRARDHADDDMTFMEDEPYVSAFGPHALLRGTGGVEWSTVQLDRV